MKRIQSELSFVGGSSPWRGVVVGALLQQLYGIRDIQQVGCPFALEYRIRARPDWNEMKVGYVSHTLWHIITFDQRFVLSILLCGAGGGDDAWCHT